MDRRKDIVSDYYATSRLPFDPNLNVAIDDMATLDDETHRLLSKRYSIIRTNFIKEDIQ